MTILAAPPAVVAMSRRLTLPFARGADLLELAVVPAALGDALAVTAYDFTEHAALFGREPEASYVLRATGAVADGTTVVATFVDTALPGGRATMTVTCPAATMPGDSFAIPLPAGAGTATRLEQLEERVGGIASAQVAGHWSVIALLGTTARLLWVLGTERDRLTQVGVRVRAQRSVETALGTSLDLLGADLGVPRFPPTPYSFDADTIALYHLDDPPGAVPPVADVTGAFPGRVPHDGTPSGAVEQGGPGRYEYAAGFGPGGRITVASHADLDIPATASFTVECFVRPDPATTTGTVVSRSGPGFGWSIEVGDVGLGVPGGVRAIVHDGALTLQVAAAVSLPTDRFSHLAAVLSRDPAHPLADRWELFVDSTSVGSVPVGGLGAIGGNGNLVIGPDATGFVGAVDEVRLSSNARLGFHPALGEGDEQYRKRLRLFRHWELPTPGNLQSVLNRLVPQIDGVADPFVVTDVDSPIQHGHHVIRVWPKEIAPAQGIDASGRLGVSEGELWTIEASTVDPGLLGRHHHVQINYRPPGADPGRDPSLAPPDPRLMLSSTAAALDRLVAVLVSFGVPGTLTVTAGFDQAIPDGRAQGRAVLLSLPGTSPGRLSALAHRAGFDFVEFRLPTTVYAACAPGHGLLLGPPNSGLALGAGQIPEVTVGLPVTVTAANSTPTWDAPAVPADATVRYFAIPTKTGRGTLSVAQPTDTTATLSPVAAGPLGLSVDVAHSGHVTTVSSCVRVLPPPLADGESIAADGTTGLWMSPAAPMEPGFDPAYLTNLIDARIDFGAAPSHHRMQQQTAARLQALADRLATDGVVGSVRVLAAYDSAAPAGDPAGRGRLLRLEHTALAADAFAVAVHRAGFDAVARMGTTVLAADAPADLVGVSGPDAIEVGTTATYTVDPPPAAVSPTTRLAWSSGQVVQARDVGGCVELLGVTNPDVQAIAVSPGVAWVQAILRDASSEGPYAFRIGLQPALAGHRISRDDYYLLMNALNTLHPVGVEVRTDALRSAVVELGNSPSGLDPLFTFPPFRLHRAAAGIRKGDQR